MTLREFKDSLIEEHSPDGISSSLRALWQDANGNWDAAHKIAQDISDNSGAWVHAYLHRKEGDVSNASYWYARAGKTDSTLSLEAEWDEIASTLLENE